MCATRAPAVAAVLFLLTVPSVALELTFDPVALNFEPVSQEYGDRVTENPQSGFSYGEAGGFTPQVEVSYGPIPPALPSLWTVGYGDLVNVLFENQDGFGQLEVTFTADPGWRVALHRIDLAAYANIGPINSLSVRDSSGAVLFFETDAVVPATGHRTVLFEPPLDSPVLVLAFDSGNLGSLSDDVGLDNIMFSQIRDPVPVEPLSWGTVKSRHR